MEHVVEVEHVALALEEGRRLWLWLRRQECVMEGDVAGPHVLQRDEDMAVGLEVDGDILNAAEHLPRCQAVVEGLEGQTHVELGLGGNQTFVAAPDRGPDERLEVVVGEAEQAAEHQLLGLLPVDPLGLTLLELDAVDDALPRAEDPDDLDAGIDVQVLGRVAALHEKLDSSTQWLDVVLAQEHEVRLDVVLALIVGPHVLLDLEGALPQHLRGRRQDGHVLVVVRLEKLGELLSRRALDLRCPCAQDPVELHLVREVLL
mmetsp:Transcript_8659/g.27131  ORF Transcript_8659/g.27131 Transcript_8659/m.27131 type:complete len:260 (+) Transcript_8659:2930-3709(+)